ncbi:hypothetical protein FALBO_6906 [Fusarium albosuccineum]|uniref:Nucleoside phosphorylase domain-containing protein n=1 Tax=Fusarium albosuccineum TaxID=1237068 RepID=A0A8H4LB80_9HYPO|nr:hypothetical protein FALBO_6906 [Fusarium albosuccineum]
MNSPRPQRPQSRDDFEIAIICALSLEADAVLSVFDHHWDNNEGHSLGKARGDPIAYSTGVIGHHNVVLAHLPGMGKVAAGNIAAFCRMSFLNISLALVVGVCGGAPIYDRGQILLGDIVVSTGVVQYDLGRRFPDKFEIKDTLNESQGRPNIELRSLFAKLTTAREREELRSKTQGYLDHLYQSSQDLIQYPGRSTDHLFPAQYRHKHHDQSVCTVCASCCQKTDPVCDAAPLLTCAELGCDASQCLPRFSRLEDDEGQPCPTIHFGTIACGDTVMKSGEDRDLLAREKNAIAFEMESVGVWDVFPCVVVKGVCDYADSHKNKHWQPYAAASAAACTKALLQYWISTARGSRAQVEAKDRSVRLLNSLKFSEMNARRNTISSEAPATFRWIFGYQNSYDDEPTDNSSSKPESLSDGSDNSTVDDRRLMLNETTIEDDPDYAWLNSISDCWSHVSGTEPQWDNFCDWLECDQPVYWISGKPGSGKSTLMKFIVSNRRTKASLEKWRPGAIIGSHFFWKPGSSMQHSLKGCLCSLLYQILSLDGQFLSQELPGVIKFQDKNSPSDWDHGELDRLLVGYAKQPSRPLCIFIDALDEVALEQDAVDLLKLVKRLNLPGIKICVSSRPERLFGFHLAGHPGLRIHDLTRNDIMEYSETTIRDSISHKPRGLVVSRLALKIATLAEGVFLWAVLVTRSLIRGINNGDPPSVINQRLQATPRDLMDLYRDILSRSEADRPIYQKDASLIFNLIFVGDSKRNMTLFQLLTATNDALLDSYANHKPRLPQPELNEMCQRILVLLEVGCAGLLKATPDLDCNEIAHYHVSLSHRTAGDFLFDTEDGRNLWNRCELTREEILIKRTKALLAEYWLRHIVLGQPLQSLTRSLVFRQISLWNRQLKLPHAFVALLLKLVQKGHERGCLVPSRGASSLMPKDPTGRFLLDAARYEYHEFVKDSLMTLETTRAAEIANCILFDLAGGGKDYLPHQSETDIEFMRFLLKNGGKPNWVQSERHGDNGNPDASCSTRSIWLQYLVQLLSHLAPSEPNTLREYLAKITVRMFRVFINAGARMDSVTKFGLKWAIGSGSIQPDRIIFEANAKWLVEILLSVLGVSDFELGPNETPSYIRALAFGNWRLKTVFVIVA